MFKMDEFRFGKDLLSFVSIITTLFALIVALISPEIAKIYLIPLIVILFIVLFLYIINYFRKQLEVHSKEIKKMNEKINIHRDISDLKAKVEILMKGPNMGKRGNADLVEIIIKVIQITAIAIAGFIILKALGVL
jgi:hypothetical protein